LDNYKINLSEELIAKLLKLWGLSFKRNIRKPKKNWLSNIFKFLKSRANLLRKMLKNAKINKCFQSIVSDVTEIKYCNGSLKAYLCVHLDYFGKMIYGYHLNKKNDNFLTCCSFKKAIKKLKSLGISYLKNIVMHQDRGSNYTSNEYASTVLSEQLFLSYSKKGEPGDNAVNESFFSRFKEEWRDILYEVKDYNDLNRMIKKAIEYYNNKRYHSSIGYQTPLFYTKMQLNYLTHN